MSDKLGIGDIFPDLQVDLVNGQELTVPSGLNSPYKVILFYRGHWWPYCRRQLDGFSDIQKQLDDIGVQIVAASVDPIDKAQEVSDSLNFPVGFGITKEIADTIGSWWEERRQIIQPSEFIIGEGNKVIASSYSDGPLGRMDAADIIKLITFLESKK